MHTRVQDPPIIFHPISHGPSLESSTFSPNMQGKKQQDNTLFLGHRKYTYTLSFDPHNSNVATFRLAPRHASMMPFAPNPVASQRTI